MNTQIEVIHGASHYDEENSETVAACGIRRCESGHPLWAESIEEVSCDACLAFLLEGMAADKRVREDKIRTFAAFRIVLEARMRREAAAKDKI